MAQNINPFYSSQNPQNKSKEEKPNLPKDNHAVSKRYANGRNTNLFIIYSHCPQNYFETFVIFPFKIISWLLLKICLMFLLFLHIYYIFFVLVNWHNLQVWSLYNLINLDVLICQIKCYIRETFFCIMQEVDCI